MAKGDEQNIMSHQQRKKHIEDELLPADAGQKPLQLQRRRVWRACESCRRKKIKCDGCEPTCSQCTASGSQCTWLQTKDRAALSRQYVQELEARLLHMESVFSQITPVLEQLGPSVNGGVPILASTSSNPTPKAENPGPSSSSSSEQHGSEPSTPIKAEDDVSESFGQLALDEYGHMRWIGGSSTMSLIQSFRALTTSPLHRISPAEEDPRAPGPSVNKLYFPASVFFGKIHALPGPEDVEYPERDLADKLVEAYFTRLHFLMPVLDKPSFLDHYRHLMDNKDNLRVVRSQGAFIALIFSVFACAAPLVNDHRLTSDKRIDEGGMGMLYYERALTLQYISHANIQIAHVQCFILLSSFLCSVNCLPQAWLLVGQAVRSAQDLGLHRSPRRLLVSPIEKETRRKIWWGVYTLDRMLALALGRPLGINDADCDIEMPAEVDDGQLAQYFMGALLNQRHPPLMAGMIALFKLYEIGGRVLRQVYAVDICKDNLEVEKKADLQRVVEALDAELTKWCDDLPPAFKSASETEEQVSMGAVLCSHYYSVLTTLHRNFLPVKRDQPVTPKSTVKAVSSARSCIRLAPSIKHVVPPSHHLAFFIQHLFSSAVILLLYAMHAPEPRAASAAMDEAKSTLTALESWEGQWPGARKCKELLLELTGTATEAINKNDKANVTPLAGPSVPTTVGTSGASRLNERRRSVTITNVPTGTARMNKNRTRRNHSRDPSTSSTSSRRLAAVSPYRVDPAHRARSSSRRRGLEDDGPERGNLAYYQLASPKSNPTASSHSSPASVNLPSPAMPVLENVHESPPPTGFNNFVPPVSPIHSSSSNHFDYDYPIQTSLGQQGSRWNNADGQGLDGFQDAGTFTTPFNQYTSPVDGSFTGFDTGEMGNAISGLSTTPPSSTFAATGLPFSGLEFIRNYNPGGYSTEQDSLWQSYDPGAFGYDPELPFTLCDLTTEGQEGTH
ncbi:Fungal specific transcription factor domain containing protein [Amanita muscaria]